MLKNKEIRRMIIAAAVITVAASACGYIFCGGPAFLIIFLTGALLTALFLYQTKKRYESIAELSSYLEKVLAGKEAPDILDQEEGELSLLRTDIYKATTALTHQKELLAADKTALSDAIADISHQLKTPLTSMTVMNDLLKTEEDREKREEFLKTQSDQLDRMNWLIRTLLKLSGIDAGTITMEPEDIRVEEFLPEVLKPFEIPMDIRNMKLLHVPSGAVLKCDRNWTVEAMRNIVKNCIEHMEDGGVLGITVTETGICTDVVIRDDGCGIAKEDLPHIFERFYKGKNAGKDSVGIGLALAKTIMNGQHGDILVKSREGEGTEFTLRFYRTVI